MKNTKIEWCDSTVNPTGFQCCGCELWNKTRKDCYAGIFTERYNGEGAFSKPVVLKPGKMAEAARWSDLRGTKRPDKPWLDGRPRVIFIGDMADTLQPGVPFEFLWREIIDVVKSKEGSRHVWMWLTKQAKRMFLFEEFLANFKIGWPENLWPGVSVTSERTTWRVDELCKIRSANRFISYEPAWEYVDFSRWTWQSAGKDDDGIKQEEPSYKIALIITGGQSGRGAGDKPFNVSWASSTIDLCEHDHVNCFVKQLGSNCITDNANLHDWPETTRLKARGKAFASARAMLSSKGGNWDEWPEELRVRQFPEV